MRIYGIDLDPIIEAHPELEAEIRQSFTDTNPPLTIGIVSGSEIDLLDHNDALDGQRFGYLREEILEFNISDGLKRVLAEAKPTYQETEGF